MHRTLKSETAQPPRANAEAQQKAFDEFRRCFNEERPHEALGNRTPASVYQTSLRRFPDTLSDPEYPEGLDIQRVNRQGNINLFGGYAVLSRVLIGQAIGIEAVDDGRWRLWFGPVYLGLLSKVGKARLESPA